MKKIKIILISLLIIIIFAILSVKIFIPKILMKIKEYELSKADEVLIIGNYYNFKKERFLERFLKLIDDKKEINRLKEIIFNNSIKKVEYEFYKNNLHAIATKIVTSIVYYNRKKNEYSGFKIRCNSVMELNKYVCVDVENPIISKIYEEIIKEEDIKNELLEKNEEMWSDDWKEVFLYYKNLLKKESD